MAPSRGPTTLPTSQPSQQPTDLPTLTSTPTISPSMQPTRIPTLNPTNQPTIAPTDNPTPSPSYNPTATPTQMPTASPTVIPTTSPSATPTIAPTAAPTLTPTPLQPPTQSPTGPRIFALKFSVAIVGLTSAKFARDQTAYRSTLADIMHVAFKTVYIMDYDESFVLSGRRLLSSSLHKRMQQRHRFQAQRTSIINVRTLLLTLSDAEVTETTDLLLEAKVNNTLRDGLRDAFGESGLNVFISEQPIAISTPHPIYFPWSTCCLRGDSTCCPFSKETISCCFPTWRSCCPLSSGGDFGCAGSAASLLDSRGCKHFHPPKSELMGFPAPASLVSNPGAYEIDMSGGYGD